MHAVRRWPLLCAIVAAGAVVIAGCKTSVAGTAPISAGPARDSSAIQTDTTIYYGSQQGSQWVISGAMIWTITGTKGAVKDTAFAYLPCHPEQFDAVVTIERADDASAVAYSQQLGCSAATLRIVQRGQTASVHFTVVTPLTAAVADRTGRMRIRLILCSLASTCTPIPTSQSPASNVFEVR